MTVADLLTAIQQYPPGTQVSMRAGWGPFIIDEALVFESHVRLWTATIPRWAREVISETSGQPRQLRTAGELSARLLSIHPGLPVFLSGPAARTIEFEVHHSDAIYLDSIEPTKNLHEFPDIPPSQRAATPGQRETEKTT